MSSRLQCIAIRYTCHTTRVTSVAQNAPDRGSALFNNRHLVAVVAAIAGRAGADFSTRQLARSCGLADSVVRSVLQRLVGADLIHEHARRGGVRGELLYRLQDRAGWDLLVSLCQKLTTS